MSTSGNKDKPADPVVYIPDPKADTVLGEWVYCRQHRRSHRTGWCTVPVSEKLGLGIVGNDDAARSAAARKCQDFNLPIHTVG